MGEVIELPNLGWAGEIGGVLFWAFGFKGEGTRDLDRDLVGEIEGGGHNFCDALDNFGLLGKDEGPLIGSINEAWFMVCS